jgi:hypothetical protein
MNQGALVKNQLFRALPVVLFAAACLYTYRAEESETHAYAGDGVNRVAVETRNGSINAFAGLDSSVTVNVLKHAYGRNKADAEKALVNVVYSGGIVGGELRARVDIPSGPRPYGADFTVTSPEGIRLALTATNGPIKVSNMVGGTDATSTNDEVVLVGTTGAARLSTTNAAIDVRVHRGGIDASTTNGPIDCDLAELAPTEAVALATTNGDVTLLLPVDVSATIDATNSNATIAVFDFSAVVYEVQQEHHVRARIGSGASSVTITTTNASITVRARS